MGFCEWGVKIYESKWGRGGSSFFPDHDPLRRGIFLMFNSLKSKMNLCMLCIKIQFIPQENTKYLH